MEKHEIIDLRHMCRESLTFLKGYVDLIPFINEDVLSKRVEETIGFAQRLGCSVKPLRDYLIDKGKDKDEKLYKYLLDIQKELGLLENQIAKMHDMNFFPIMQVCRGIINTIKDIDDNYEPPLSFDEKVALISVDDTERGKKICRQLINDGLLKETSQGFEWTGEKNDALIACFFGILFCGDSITRITDGKGNVTKMELKKNTNRKFKNHGLSKLLGRKTLEQTRHNYITNHQSVPAALYENPKIVKYLDSNFK